MYQISSSIEGTVQTVSIYGRIDSTNAADAEKEILSCLQDFTGSLILDAEKLAYISSAGLRIILRLKKTFPDTSIINVSPDVYEIFDMTGFTEMMDISKAYRQISIDGCEVIGEGANGKVYRIDTDTIVKVYKNHDALAEIHKERELARKAFVMGVPTAIPYDVVRVGDLYGSVFELLNAKSFAKLIVADPDKIEEYAKESVDILKTIHSTILKPGELPNKKADALVWANYSRDYLPTDLGDKLVRMVNDIPDTLNMLHGDFHVKNIMRQNGENLLIDMDTLSMGHPIFEFAGIFLAYIGFSCIDPETVYRFIGIRGSQARRYWNAVLRYYFNTEDPQFLQQIEDICAIISYSRILRRTVRRPSGDNAFDKKQIDFCKNTLCELLSKTEKLYF